MDDKCLYLPPQAQQHTNSTCSHGAHARVCVLVRNRERQRERGGDGGRGGRLLYLTADPQKIFDKRRYAPR